jgi:hypothetical protein
MVFRKFLVNKNYFLENHKKVWNIPDVDLFLE